MAMVYGHNVPNQEPKLGIICGLEDEAKALGKWRNHRRVMAGVIPGDARRIRRACDMMWKEGVRLILSWGVAGGLDPQLAPGDVIVADGVVTPTGRALPLESERVPGAGLVDDQPPMLIAGVPKPVLTADAKAALHTQTGAVAVDLETHLIAAEADAAAFPAIAIRAIADTVSTDVPAFAAEAVGPDGKPRMMKLAAGVLGNLGELKRLRQLGRDYRMALDALAQTVDEGVIHHLVETTPRI